VDANEALAATTTNIERICISLSPDN